MSYSISWEDKGVFVKWYDRHTYKDLLECNGIIYGDRRYENIEYEVADFSEVKSFEITEKEALNIGTLEEKSSIWNKELKVAHITTNEAFIKMVNLYADKLKDTKWKIGIFSNKEDAYQWVG